MPPWPQHIGLNPSHTACLWLWSCNTVTLKTMPLRLREDEKTERGLRWWSITLLLIWEWTALIKARECGGEKVPRPNEMQSDRVLKERSLMGLRWMSLAVDMGVVETSLPSRHRIRSDTSGRLHVTTHSAHGQLLWQHNKNLQHFHWDLKIHSPLVCVCVCVCEWILRIIHSNGT